MATVRARKLKDGSTSYIIQVKFKDKGSGNQILRTTTWKPEDTMSEKQIERAVTIFADNFEKEVKNTVNGCTATAENPNITFRDFADKWLEKTQRDCSLTYYEHSKDILKLANQYIGGFKIRELNPAIIQNFYDKLDKLQKTTSRVVPKPEFREVLETHGFKYMNLRYDYHVQACTLANAFAGKPVSKGWSIGLAEKTGIPFEELFDEKIIVEPYAYETINKIKRTVRAVLSLAKKNRLIDDNYALADYINFPKRPTHRIECMDDEEAKLFYKTVMEYPNIRYKTAMLLFLLTGFRRGEVAGLQWGDIDFEEKTITVNRSLTTVTGHGVVLKEPKTENSKRTITIADTLVNALQTYRKWWVQRREDFGDYMQENDYLFTQENGERLNPSTYTGWLNKVLKAAGLDHHSLHSLRHTNITMQIAAGVPLVTVSARAGHARTSTTSDIYAHFIKSSDKTAAQVIDKMFTDEPKRGCDTAATKNTETKFTKNSGDILESADTHTTGSSEDRRLDFIDEFKKTKEEMKRLGFETLEEYEKYLDFIELQQRKKAQKNKDFEM